MDERASNHACSLFDNGAGRDLSRDWGYFIVEAPGWITDKVTDSVSVHHLRLIGSEAELSDWVESQDSKQASHRPC